MTEEEQTAPADESARSSGETPAAPDQAVRERIAELERQVAELERQLAGEREAATDYMNRWQRAQADFANFKRRAQQDQAQVQRTLAIEAARLVLPALDSFERAFSTLPESLQGYTWISGVALVEMQLRGVLNAAGIQPVAVAPGHAFDPAKHEAIGEVETAEHPDGRIAVVVQPGYEVEGLLLRPALVQIARAPRPTTSDGASEPAEAETPETANTAETTTIEAETTTSDAPASYT